VKHVILDPEQVRERGARYKRGETVWQLAVAFNLHKTTVSAHLERLDIPRRGDRRRNAD